MGPGAKIIVGGLNSWELSTQHMTRVGDEGRINLLAQKLSTARHIPFITTAHRAHDTVAFLVRKVLDFIPPTLWPPNSKDLSSADYLQHL